MKQTRYRALDVYVRLRRHGDDCMLKRIGPSESKEHSGTRSTEESDQRRSSGRGCSHPQSHGGESRGTQGQRTTAPSPRYPRTEEAREPRQDPRRRGHDPPVPDLRGFGWQVQGAARRVLFGLTRTAQGFALWSESHRQETCQRPGTGLNPLLNSAYDFAFTIQELDTWLAAFSDAEN